MAHINPQIFREYDIRGIVDKDLNENVLERIGRAYGTYIKEFGARVVSIGRDCRLSTPMSLAMPGSALRNWPVSTLTLKLPPRLG